MKLKWHSVVIALLIVLVGYMGLCTLAHASDPRTVAIRPGGKARVSVFPPLALVASPGTEASGSYIYEIRYCLPALIRVESVESGTSRFRFAMLEPGKTVIVAP